MIKWKVDVMEKLKSSGYSTYRIRNEKLIGQQMLVKIRRGDLPSWATLDKICTLVGCQPGDLIEHVNYNDSATNR